MGYYGVKTALDVINGMNVPKYINTGVEVVTMDNFYDPEIQKRLNITK
jgi:ABC-type sugar transport system substrate-binding protein